MENKIKLGFCLTGSFCTFSDTIPQIELLQKSYEVYPVMSFNASSINTRFGMANDFKDKIQKITSKKVMDTLVEVEPFGPKKVLDILVVCPCTGNTLAKLANGISDTPTTLAVKSHLRNSRPVIIAVSTNDGLAGSSSNIATLLEKKNIYFVPFSQDDCIEKPTSLVAHFDLLEKTIKEALNHTQIQPLLY